MSTFLLIHGSWHGAWCWYKVVPRLQAAGHTALAIDLPGLGADKTPVSSVTLDLWNEKVCDVIDTLNDRVILVGHSRGGLLNAQASQSRSDAIACAVYLTAAMLDDGQSMLESAGQDERSLVSRYLQIHDDQGYATIAAEGIQETFYGDCDEQDVTLARMLLQPEPLAPLATPLSLSAQSYGRVPRVYIECLRDKAITIDRQRVMIEQSGCNSVLTLDTDHSPFFCAPDELVTHLLSVAEEYS